MFSRKNYAKATGIYLVNPDKIFWFWEMITSMEKNDYTFELSPGEKKRYIAGAYDPKQMTPQYEIIIDVPNHVKPQVLCEQILVGKPEKCNWGYNLENKSSWSAFVIVKKDGVMIE